MIPHVLATLLPAGPVARGMEDLWWWMLWLGTAAFVVFAVALALALRRRGEADDEGVPLDDGRRSGRVWLVGAGVVQPAVLIGITFALTLVGMQALPEAEEGDLVIEVIGHQWWFEVRYPEAGVTTANEVHLPVGERVEFRLSSADVIHSFWIPQLAGKIDMLPDGPTSLVVIADEPGEYPGQCAEFCGLQHARMGLVARAEPREDFDAWLAAQAEPAAPPQGATAQRGQDVLRGSNCVECHTIRGVDGVDGDRGPDLTHLASRDTIAARTLANEPALLRDWIHDPDAFKEGVDMPSSPLSDDDLDALVAYLEGLE
ncbi:cytochrome c oxidase subunit II [Euzebya sp.]|uniref:cytochrome c oxidase subunit II n=1 Tax=Euzebya sp. TaxID=1971409 RepID=UPI0035148E1E